MSRPRQKKGFTRVIDPSGRRRLTRGEKAGVASVATLVGVGLIGLVAGLLIDRLLDFNDVLDTGGEWDEGGGVFTRWD